MVGQLTSLSHICENFKCALVQTLSSNRAMQDFSQAGKANAEVSS